MDSIIICRVLLCCNSLSSSVSCFLVKINLVRLYVSDDQQNNPKDHHLEQAKQARKTTNPTNEYSLLASRILED